MSTSAKSGELRKAAESAAQPNEATAAQDRTRDRQRMESLRGGVSERIPNGVTGLRAHARGARDHGPAMDACCRRDRNESSRPGASGAPVLLPAAMKGGSDFS